MIIGAMNNPHKSLVEEIHLFGEMNFDYAEITVERPRAGAEWVAEHKKQVLDALGSYNLGVLSHMPWYFSVAHPYERIQRAMEMEFSHAFRSAALLGAKKVTIHTETLSPSVQGRKMHVQNTIAGIKRIDKLARDFGLELHVENLDAKSFSIKEFHQLFSEVDCAMTLDIGHASTARGEGFENFYKAFAPRIKHVHLHDNYCQTDDHLPLGAGKMDIEEIVKSLKTKYDGTITLEVHSSDRHYLEYSRERLEILWYGKKRFLENREYLQPEKKEE
ncbi:MAG: sugar phosphate isomerase/epimerase [Candidatus Micrarchaeota archaeon]